jgi:hypothetical protein
MVAYVKKVGGERELWYNHGDYTNWNNRTRIPSEELFNQPRISADDILRGIK